MSESETILTWPQRAWRWLAALIGGLIVGAGIYFAGRRTGRGDATSDAARDAIDAAKDGVAALKKSGERTAKEILEEQERRRLINASKLSDEEVTRRLQEMGLLK